MTAPTDTEQTHDDVEASVADTEQTHDDVEASVADTDSTNDDVDDVLAGRPGPVGRVTAELRRVTWPTRREFVTYSLVVVTFLVAVTAAVAGVDGLFGSLILRLLG